MIMDVYRIFPNLEKLKRTRRGQQPTLKWHKAPSLQQILEKIGSIIDSNIKISTNIDARSVEMHRYLLRKNNAVGYFCINIANINLNLCKSYEDLQSKVNLIERSILWKNNLTDLIAHINAHCTSPTYIAHVNNIKI